jgi:ribosome recycling factor
MLDPVTVEAYGSQMPINQVATVSVPEPRMISVAVWDKTMVGKVERAIRDSNLGLNPVVDGMTLRLPIPELNAERRKELIKLAHKYAEQSKVAVRHVRRDGMDTLKKLEKDGAISEDDGRVGSDRVQKMTDEMIAEIDQILAKKEQEISQV